MFQCFSSVVADDDDEDDEHLSDDECNVDVSDARDDHADDDECNDNDNGVSSYGTNWENTVICTMAIVVILKLGYALKSSISLFFSAPSYLDNDAAWPGRGGFADMCRGQDGHGGSAGGDRNTRRAV
jgi:hypothetical protein